MNKSNITVIDYGMGNLWSVLSALRYLGCNPTVSSDPNEITCAGSLVLPGVGSFRKAVDTLRQTGLDQAILDAVQTKGVKILGICLGMQLMCRSSEEGELPGLGWFDADVKLIKLQEETNLKVPHMGWNTIDIKKPNALFDAEGEQRFYFVHSYHVVCNDPSDVIATTHHGYDWTAAFSNQNIYGVQFHPEKSHRFGMELIKRFLKLPC